jgi:hypothetical protein
MVFLCGGSVPHSAIANERAAEVLTETVQKATRNELQAQAHDHSLWRFREEQQKDGKRETLQVCQTSYGNLERVVAVDGRPIDAHKIHTEDERILKLVAHPDEVREKQRKTREDERQMQTLLEVFPQAFRFQRISQTDNRLTLRFTPNSSFHPSSHVVQVFHHMEGTLAIDTRANRIAEIQGKLTSEVKFGGGFFGHLDRGGTFHVKQEDVGGGHWDVVLMSVQIGGKMLFFKTIAVHESEIYTRYAAVAQNTTLRQAAQILKKECEVSAAASTQRGIAAPSTISARD